MSGLAWVCGVVYIYIYMVSSTKRQRCTPHVIARYARSHAKTPAWLVVVRRAAARVPPRPHVPKIAQIGLPVRQNLPLSALPCSYSILFVYMRKGSRSDSLVNRKMYTRKRVNRAKPFCENVLYKQIILVWPAAQLSKVTINIKFYITKNLDFLP